MDSGRRYRAFISYSHRDHKAAEWVHRSLETFRAPRQLTTRGGQPAERTLTPIFRDREELAASPDLGEVIRDALDRSDTLIVLCSETSAASRWVDQEVAHFLEGRRVDQVICVIAPAVPADAVLTEVLPPALLAALPEGAEPLAVDLRRDADGARLARLKIVARLLDVSLDQLVQRDARRRLRVMAGFTAAAVVLTLAMAGMTVATLKSRQIARDQRDETEALVAYMLGDLRKQLEPVGRLDLMDGVSAKVLTYYAKARTDKLDDNALAQRAKAQTLLGTIREQRSDLAGAQDAFAQAAATTHELVERDPENGERIYDEAQNVYWLAYMKWRRGDMTGAEQGFKQYGELARTLVGLDPGRADWRIEVPYSKSNLGTLLFEQNRAAEALAAFREAQIGFDAERARAPKDKDRIVDSFNARAWSADSLAKLGRLREALVERESGARLLAEAAAREPADRPLASRNIGSQFALARLELDLGKTAQARSRAATSIQGMRDLVALDPTNARWRQFLVIGQLDLVDFALWSAPLARARAEHAEAAALLAALRTGDDAKTWNVEIEGRMKQQEIHLARLAGDEARTRALAGDLLDRLAKEGADKNLPLRGFAELAAGRPGAAVAILSPQRALLTPAMRDVLARALLASGKRDQAEGLVRELRAGGYAHPGFLAFWRDSPLGGVVGREDPQ